MENNHQWITYDCVLDILKCSVCSWVDSKQKWSGKKTSGRHTAANNPFISGWCDWRKGNAALLKHEISDLHHEANLIYDKLHSNIPSIAQTLDKSYRRAQIDARFALDVIFDSILYLAKQGQALRGHIESEGNFQQLLNLIAKYYPTIKTWLEREGCFK